MKKFLPPLWAMLLFILLTACGGNSDPPAVAPKPMPVPQPEPQTVAEVPKPMIPVGWASDEFMEDGVDKVRENPAAFGEFFAAYLDENAQSIVTSIEFSPQNVGRLFDVPITEEPQPTGQNKVLISYHQLPNDEASIEGHRGVFLDGMARLPAEQIPNSLLACDKLITLTSTPETAFTYENDMPGIRWIIEVSCREIAGGQTRTEYFNGGEPGYVAWYEDGDKYIGGGFPLPQAVDYALLLAATEPGKPLPAPIEPVFMSVDSDGMTDSGIADEYAMRGRQLENGVPTRSLPLIIENAPANTVCFALIMQDVTAFTDADNSFKHWLATNFTATELPANSSIDNASLMVQGRNDFGSIGYGGPTPTDNELHYYSLTVYALDAELPLVNGFSYSELQAALQGHILDMSTLEATYSSLF